MFGLFKKKYSDEEKRVFLIESLAKMLTLQAKVVDKDALEEQSGKVNRKALGYILGFSDAAFQASGRDQSKVWDDVPTIFAVLTKMYGLEKANGPNGYMSLMMKYAQDKDKVFNIGVMTGGQEYVKWLNTKFQYVPTGFFKFLQDGEDK